MKLHFKANWFFLIIFILISAITVGFSAWNAEITINDSELVIRVDKNVRIMSVMPYSSGSSNGGISTAEDYGIDKIYSDIILPNANSTVSYEVTVRNYGNVEVGIADISLPDNLKDTLKVVSIDGYTLKDKIRDNENSCAINNCTLSIERTFVVTLGYVNESVYNSLSTEFNNVVLSFDFEIAHNVVLVNFENIDYLPIALLNSSYEVYVGDEVVEVMMSGVKITDYTLVDGLLTINNVTGDISIEKLKRVILTFDGNGGNVGTASKEVIYGLEYGSLPTPVREGYTFSGWAYEKAGKEIVTEKTIVNTTENHTLYAQWNAKSYTIRFHANGGEGTMVDQVIKYDAIVALSKNTFVRENYSFFGWSLSENGDKVYNDMDSVVNLKLEGIVDLYAIWKQNSYTVTFDYNGGSGSSDEMQVLYGEPYGALPDYPYLEGKLFIGWYTEQTGGTQVYSHTIVDRRENHTLYAHWEESPSNTAILNLVIKNVPDQNGDGVMDAIYLSFMCSSSFEKYNIPLKNLVVGQKYKLSFTASNNAAFGTSEAGYKSSMYGSIITKEGTLSAGSIKDEAIADGGLIAQWSDRTKGDTWLNGPFDREMIFTAEAETMYWTWDFGLMMDYVLYDFNFTNITLEPVIPKINFADKRLVIHTTSKAQVLNDVSNPYSTNFVFDGDSYAETLYYSITDLTPGSKYTITFNHTFNGALIDDSSKTSNMRYDYGCGIMNSAPTTYGSFMSGLGTWASNTFVMTSVTGNTQTVTLTFTATSNTAYWVWNMANCSDSINNTIDVNITNFSATHSGGGAFNYYTADS